MSSPHTIDGVLVEWGDRLFYPLHRIVPSHTPRLRRPVTAASIRRRIESTVRRAPQVMVKVTGGGRGMLAIAAHLRYISKNGRLRMEDDRGAVETGKDSLKGIERQWRVGGSLIEPEGHRREAFNIMLSMPRGTDPMCVLEAARDFARMEFADHRYVMVLHEHQANPHVHLSVKAESRLGRRLNPRKADLHRWREAFAEQLRARGIRAEATRQATRGEYRHRDALWQGRARQEDRLTSSRPTAMSGRTAGLNRVGAFEAWQKIAGALAESDQAQDRLLAEEVKRFINDMPAVRAAMKLMREQKARERERQAPTVEARKRAEPVRAPERRGPEMER